MSRCWLGGAPRPAATLTAALRAVAALALAAGEAFAQLVVPPPLPLPPPFPPALPIYSIAAGSPSPFLPSDILAPNPIGGSPFVVIPSATFGLLPADDIDAIAYVRPNTYPMFFSVDRTSTGLPGAFPNDVVIQAGLGQAAGDVFMTAYPPRVPQPGVPFTGPQAGTNLLIFNQDQLDLMPAVDQGTPVAPPIDDLDALELAYIADGQPTPAGLIYSLAPGSPTLALLGATPGDLITTIGGAPTLIPFFRQITGLLPTDDVDALAWDSVFDTIGFSLSRGSPSLASTPWGQFGKASSLFTVRLSGPTANQVFVALPHHFIGLAEGDELDAAAFPKPDPPPPPDCSIQVIGGVILGRDGFDIRGCPFTPAIAAVPEPAPIALLGTALLALAAGATVARRRR